ncbi:MAG: hypothetical protein JJT96_15490 [Opitutales bacterium]|nr:hypothetical protein [Opitutales bacterium]
MIRPLRHILSPVVFFGFFAFPASGSLADRSPFLPPGFRVEEPTSRETPSAQPPGELENLIDFKGVYQLAGEYRLLIGKKRDPRASWLALGESFEGLDLLDFDLEMNRARVRLDGREGWVEMARVPPNPSPGVAAPSGPQRVRPATTASHSSAAQHPSRSTGGMASPSSVVSRPPVNSSEDSRLRRPEVRRARSSDAARPEIQRPAIGPSAPVPRSQPSGPPPTPAPTRRPNTNPPPPQGP